MALVINPGFSEKSIDKILNDWSGRITTVIINELTFIGETFVKNARDEQSKWKYIQLKLDKSKKQGHPNVERQQKYYRNGKVYIREANGGESFSDWTGNLRSSIGYVIFYNGKQVAGAFPGEHETGKTKAVELAQGIANEYPNGFVLVCIAGMHYAAFVESRGYDVITNASIVAKNDLIEAVARLNSKIERMK